MRENNRTRARRPFALRQQGSTAVEFALLAGLFFTLVFGIIEIARLMFVYNTLQEVTRRAAAAAANVYPRDASGMQKVREQAIFRGSPGELVLEPAVKDTNIRIEYLSLRRDPISNTLSLSPIDPGSLPSCAAQNRQVCMRDPNASNCIRFVQASVCKTGDNGDCTAVESTAMLPLMKFTIPLHKATTITPAESLGYTLGAPPCS